MEDLYFRAINALMEEIEDIIVKSEGLYQSLLLLKIMLESIIQRLQFVIPNPGGGGGGTQIWFRRGCAAEAAKPVPIFKGHFGGKWGYPLLGVLFKKITFFVYFSDEMGENI